MHNGLALIPKAHRALFLIASVVPCASPSLRPDLEGLRTTRSATFQGNRAT